MKYTRHTYIMQFPKNIQMGILRAVRRNLRERGLRGTKLDIAVNNVRAFAAGKPINNVAG